MLSVKINALAQYNFFCQVDLVLKSLQHLSGGVLRKIAKTTAELLSAGHFLPNSILSRMAVKIKHTVIYCSCLLDCLLANSVENDCHHRAQKSSKSVSQEAS